MEAVYVNDVEVAKELLVNGGSYFTNLVTKFFCPFFLYKVFFK